MFLITGFGRSGTHYTSNLLQAIGIDSPHERLGKDGCVSWKHILPGEFRYLGKRRVEPIIDPGFAVIVHQVRDPINVLSSAYTFSESTWHYMESHLGLLPDKLACRFDYHSPGDNPVKLSSDVSRRLSQYLVKFTGRRQEHAALVRRAMCCYLGWNEVIERRARWRYQIEQLSSVWPELLSQIGQSFQPMPKLSRDARDSRVDCRNYFQLEWHDLYRADEKQAEQIAEVASRYGYDGPDV